MPAQTKKKVAIAYEHAPRPRRFILPTLLFLAAGFFIVNHTPFGRLDVSAPTSERPLPPNDPRNFNFTLSSKAILLNGKPISIKGVNWYGFENANMVPEGLYANSMETYFKFLASHGFNAIRIPFSGEFAMYFDNPNVLVGTASRVLKPTYIKDDLDLVNKPPKATLTKFLNLAFKYNMLVVPDFHQFYAAFWDGGRVINNNFEVTNAFWYYRNTTSPQKSTSVLNVPNKTPDFPLEQVIKLWVKMTTFFKPFPHVFAMDLKNEPRGNGEPEDPAIWSAWADAAGKIGGAIVQANPRALIIVAGLPGRRINWGGNLLGVKNKRVKLYSRDNREVKGRVVYSPHVYGPDVAPGLEYNDKVWEHYFGYIRDAPVLIGEWGGFMNTKPGRGTGLQDLEANKRLAAYIRQKGYGAFYWALNPTSGDTGGLYMDDAWTVPADVKLRVIADAVPTPTRFAFSR